jgi:methyl-accepting chemotaxis protein
MGHIALTMASHNDTKNIVAAAVATAELRASVSDTARHVVDSSDLAQSAVSPTTGSNDFVQRLAAAAHDIGEVVGLIQSMASRTHLLALSATLEAARVGSTGQGLAVVASEVKSMAAQTNRATKGISNRIRDAQAATDQAVEAVGGIVETIDRLSSVADVIAAAVAERQAVMSEIAGGGTRPAQDTKRILQGIEGLTRTSTDADYAAQDILRSAIELSRQAATFRQEVSRLLADIGTT